MVSYYDANGFIFLLFVDRQKPNVLPNSKFECVLSRDKKKEIKKKKN